MERQLRYFRAQMEKSDIAMRSIYDFNNPFTVPSASEIDELADKSQSLEQRISSLNESYETLKKREVELTEWRKETPGTFRRRYLRPSRGRGRVCVCRLRWAGRRRGYPICT